MPTAATLLMTRDPALEADLQRLSAAAGSTLHATASLDEALRAWLAPEVVLVGADLAPELAEVMPVRRYGVHVLCRGPLPDRLFRDALAVGAESVLELPTAETWLVQTLTDTADGAVRAAVTVGVVAGSGGAGATTFAAALATVASTPDLPVTLIDTDPLGAGVEHVVGFEHCEGAHWASLLGSSGRYGSRSMRAALPVDDGLAVLGWAEGARDPLDPLVVREVVSAARRGSDLLIVDLPRYPHPASAEVLARCDHLVVVCGLSLPAVSACGRVLASLAPTGAAPHLVARGGVRGLDPEQIARTLDLPLRAVMSDQRRLAEDLDLGLGPVRSRRGPLARAARATLTHLVHGDRREAPLAPRVTVAR